MKILLLLCLLAAGCGGGVAYRAFIIGKAPSAHLHVDLDEPEASPTQAGCPCTPEAAPTPARWPQDDSPDQD